MWLAVVVVVVLMLESRQWRRWLGSCDGADCLALPGEFSKGPQRKDQEDKKRKRSCCCWMEE